MTVLIHGSIGPPRLGFACRQNFEYLGQRKIHQTIDNDLPELRLFFFSSPRLSGLIAFCDVIGRLQAVETTLRSATQFLMALEQRKADFLDRRLTLMQVRAK